MDRFRTIGADEISGRVVVYLNTFNQAAFVAATLDSVLSQKTDESFHICVFDDASTDGTQDIIANYVSRYPDRITARLHYENQFQQGRRMMKIGWPHLRGEYIAMIDGDDLWTQTDKLDRQIRFMDRHPGCTLCQTLTAYWDDRSDTVVKLFPRRGRRWQRMQLEYLARGNFVQTSSAMIRRTALPDLPADFDSIPFGDYALFALAARNGWIGLIPRKMVRYRIHGENMWADRDQPERQRKSDLVRAYIARNLPQGDRHPWNMALQGQKMSLSQRISRALRRCRLYLPAL